MINIRPINTAAISAGFGIMATGTADFSIELLGNSNTIISLVTIQPASLDIYLDSTSIFLPIDVNGTGSFEIEQYTDWYASTGTSISSDISLYLNIDSPYLVNGASAEMLIELVYQNSIATTGVSSSSFFSIEIEDIVPITQLGVSPSGGFLINIYSNGLASSAISILPTNPIELDILDMPIVAYSMNCLTKGVTAYTDNVNNQVKALVATPVDDYEVENKKCVPDLYVQLRSTDDVSISLLTNEMIGRQDVGTILYIDKDGLIERRAKLPYGINGTNFQFFIENQNGASMSIRDISPRPFLHKRKV